MATTTTPNISLAKKDYGDTGWDEMINDNSDLLDTAITADRARITATEAEIVAGRGGTASLDARADAAEARITATEAEIVAGRGGTASLLAKNSAQDSAIVALQAEVSGARGGNASIDARLDLTEAEIASARSGFGSLRLKQDDQDSKITDLQALVAGSATLVEEGVTIQDYVTTRLREHESTIQRNRIDADLTVPDGYNMLSIAPIEINPDATVTLAGNATWRII